MAANERWYFTKEQLDNTPSRKCGFDADKELLHRQQAANFIQDMGQKLLVTQLCINTAIVYMHRFYVYHSFTSFHRNAIAAASLFLAAKVEEQPRRLEHVIKVANLCLHRDQTLDIKSTAYLEQAQDLVFNEDVLLQTLGFEVAIDHPHTHVVRCCDLVGASKELARGSYFMASNTLHLTTMCLQYKPTVVACFCIHLICKWSENQIPKSSEGKEWFSYIDKSVTLSKLEEITTEFLNTFEKCPTKLKNRIKSIGCGMKVEGQSKVTGIDSPLNSKRRRVKTTENDAHDASSSRNLTIGVPSTSSLSSSSSAASIKPKDSIFNEPCKIIPKATTNSLTSFTNHVNSSSQQLPQPSGRMHASASQRKPNNHDLGSSSELVNATKRFKLDSHVRKSDMKNHFRRPQ